MASRRNKNRASKQSKDSQPLRSDDTGATTPDEPHYSMKEGLVRFAIHSVLLLPFLAHLYYTGQAIDTCPHKEKVFKNAMAQMGGRWKYLTVINQTILLVHLITACVTDIIPLPQVKRAIWSVTDVLFTSIVFPSSVIVAGTFWSLFNYDRELVYRPIMDLCIPSISNHGMHTLPMIIVVLEALLVYHRYPSHRVAFTLMAIFGGIYNSWTAFIHYNSGRGVYPFMTTYLTPLSMYIPYGIVSIVAGFGIHCIGRTIGSLVWRVRLDTAAATDRKNKKY